MAKPESGYARRNEYAGQRSRASARNKSGRRREATAATQFDKESEGEWCGGRSREEPLIWSGVPGMVLGFLRKRLNKRELPYS